MASSNVRRTAYLETLPVGFGIDFLRDSTVSLKSRQQGFKYFSEGYIHDVKMFWSDEDTIVSTAKSHRSMKKNEKPHTLHLDIQPTKICYAHCSCQAGADGSCSHLIGYILALQQWQMMGFSEVPSQLSSTSLPQQWSVPRGRKIEPTDVPHMTFVNPKPDRKRKPLQNILVDNRKIRVQPEDINGLKDLDDCPISYLISNCPETVETHLGTVPIGSGLSTHAQFFEPQEDVPVSTHCGDLCYPKVATVTVSEVCLKSLEQISQERCVRIEESTRDQASSTLWIKERKTRLTASNFGLILKRKKVTEKFIQTLVEKKSFSSAPTTYGKNQEKVAVDKYISKTGNHVHDCGLIINSAFSCLGATPDGKICSDGATGILEVKCPYKARDMNLDEACNLQSFCLEMNNSKKSLKKDHVYYYQVQGQLLVSGAQFCDFVVYTRNDLFVQRIYPDNIFMKDMLDKLCQFYLNHVKPVLEQPQNAITEM